MEMKYLSGVLEMTIVHHYDSEYNSKRRVEKWDKTLERGQLRCFGHLVRISSNMPVKRLWEFKMEVRRVRGRPVRTWNRSVEKTL